MCSWSLWGWLPAGVFTSVMVSAPTSTSLAQTFSELISFCPLTRSQKGAALNCPPPQKSGKWRLKTTQRGSRRAELGWCVRVWVSPRPPPNPTPVDL